MESEYKDEVRKCRWANVTNFENGDLTKIENSMDHLMGNKSVVNIDDISERCYIFIIFCKA